MIAFPYCKINIGLRVTARRSDGFHDIDTLFYPLPLRDMLEIVPGPETTIHLTGIAVPGSPEGNLCLKAYRLLQKDFPRLPPVSVHLHKTIPVGAGLGGGSSDAAFMLRLLNEKYRLELSAARLSGYASALGSDCAFFLRDQPCYATGRGDELSPSQVGLGSFRIVLVCPDLQVNTGWAYSRIVPAVPAVPLKQILERPVDSWRDEVKNDFEGPVFAAYPRLGKIKQSLYDRGAIYASMSGSGSSVFGLFRGDVPKVDPDMDGDRIFVF